MVSDSVVLKIPHENCRLFYFLRWNTLVHMKWNKWHISWGIFNATKSATILLIYSCFVANNNVVWKSHQRRNTKKFTKSKPSSSGGQWRVATMWEKEHCEFVTELRWYEPPEIESYLHMNFETYHYELQLHLLITFKMTQE